MSRNIAFQTQDKNGLFCQRYELKLRCDILVEILRQILAKREAAIQKDKEEAMKEVALARAAQDIIGLRSTPDKS